MVYELRHGSASLVLLAAQSAEASAEWRFEGHAMDSPELVIVGRWNATRAEAFHAMRDLWIERGDSLGLARVDWEKVEGALSSVRAL